MQTAVIDNVDVRHRKMVWSKFVPAWDVANIVMPLKTKNLHVTACEMSRVQNNLFKTRHTAHHKIIFISQNKNNQHNGKRK